MTARIVIALLVIGLGLAAWLTMFLWVTGLSSNAKRALRRGRLL